MEWQTIENAPKDGTVILIHLKKKPNYSRYAWGNIRTAKWNRHYWYHPGAMYYMDSEVSHWMPLPEPPK